MTEFYDLSHAVENGMTYFPGDPLPVIRLADGAMPPWRVTSLQIGSHTGTHIDASTHYFEQGKSIDQYPLERFIIDGICVSVEGLSADQPITLELLGKSLSSLKKGGAVVIRTGWDRFWGQELYLHHPYLSMEVVHSLKDQGAGLVGIDALNVDSTTYGSEHAHQVFLGSEILIVENLRGLDRLETSAEYHFSFLPLRLAGLDGSPIRAVAWR